MSPSSAVSSSPAAGLPSALTSFVGREREVAAVSEVLATARLVTLTGAGGSGKTRLAAEIARGISGRFADGVAWIELAAINDPGLVAAHIAATLGFDGGTRAPTDVLRDALCDSERLLVLDNCEHLIDACAAVAELILRDCPRVRILATSREALGVAGERAWLVPVLSLPPAADTLDAIRASEAVRLFADRAQAASAAFVLTDANAAAVARLCRRLDGLPLAIELAAARVRALTPEQIVNRLDDGFQLLAASRRSAVPRHRTLREAIGWSYDLLAEPERQVLQRLSVFAGALSLEAAEAVCAGDGVESDEVLDLLAAIVDKSLVVVDDRADEARYHLLETIRQFARERLDETADANAADERHARFYAALVRAAYPHFITPERPRWVDRVQRDLDDIRAVLAWSRDREPSLYVELAGKLGWFWYSSGLWTEGRRWLEEALSLSAVQPRDANRALALFSTGVIAALQGDGSVARQWLEDSAEIARELGDHSLEAYARSYVGVALGQAGLAAAEAPARAALGWFERSGDLYGQRLALLVLVTLHLKDGDLTSARSAGEEAVRVARAYGLGRELGIALQLLGTVQLHQRELDQAAATLADALRALRRDPQAFWLARAMELMGVIECVRGRPLYGARLFGAAEARRERMGAVLFRLDRERLAPHIAAARAAAGDEAFGAAWAAGRATAFEDVIDGAIAGAVVSGAANAPLDRSADASLRSSADAGEGIAVETGVAAAGEVTGAAPVLRVSALGPLEIVRDGVPVPPTAWKYARPRELFLYLLSHPEGRTREQIGLAFWPDASASQVKNNFHVMLHHLRRALGRSDLVVFSNERYQVNWALGVELDVAVFEREVVAARRALRTNPESSNAVNRLRAVLQRYRGDFLESENAGDWYLEVRDHLRRLWVDGLLALGAHLMEAESYEEAAGAYRAVVHADELNEGAHRQLMAALARSGQRGEALRHYDRFVALLRDDLGVTPERQTTLLYDRLRKAEAV